MERYDAPGATGAVSTNYSYTTDRQPAQITRPGGQAMTSTYDSAGRIATLATPTGTLTSTYGSSGRLAKVTGPHGTLQYSYDGPLQTEEQYDADGLLTRAGALTLTRDAANGLATAAAVGTVSTTYTYDRFGAGASQQASVGFVRLPCSSGW